MRVKIDRRARSKRRAIDPNLESREEHGEHQRARSHSRLPPVLRNRCERSLNELRQLVPPPLVRYTGADGRELSGVREGPNGKPDERGSEPGILGGEPGMLWGAPAILE